MSVESVREQLVRVTRENATLRAELDAAKAAASSNLAFVEHLADTMRMLVSYLGHEDQDANHEWMVMRMRAALGPYVDATKSGAARTRVIEAAKKKRASIKAFALLDTKDSALVSEYFRAADAAAEELAAATDALLKLEGEG